MQNKPKLRFKEFTDDWQEKRLEKVLKIKHGKDQKQVECKNGKYPILATGGEIGRTNQYLWDKPSVLIGRKGTINKPRYMDTPFWTVDTLFYSDVNKDNNAKFLYYLFNIINWKKYDESTGVPSLSAKTIERIKVFSTNKYEQEKVASFLSKVDELINEHESEVADLEAQKKGLMQKLFTQQIRFKDSNGNNYPAWKENFLGEISQISTGKGDVQDSIINGKYPFFDRSEIIKTFDDYLFDNEAIIYSGEGSSFYPKYYNGKYGLHQRCYTIYGFNNKSINGKYLFYFMNTQNKHFVKMAVGSTVPSLRMDCFTKCKVLLPLLEEQEKIANVLCKMDELITEKKALLEDWKQFKKGLLQQMFV